MLDYEEFKGELIEKIKSCLDAGLQLSLTKITKINNVVKEAVTFKGECGTTLPVFYIQDCYEYYQENQDMEECISAIMDLLRALPSFDKEILSMPWSDVRSKLQVQLINREWNKVLLKDTPFLNVCDLAIVCRVVLQENDEGRVSFLVKNSMLEYWGIEKKQLWETAFVNLRNGAYQIQAKENILPEIYTAAEETAVDKDDDVMMLYILSNKYYIDGAAGMLRTDILQNLSEKLQTDLYILPSSLHEVILIPVSQQIDVGELRQMVKNVNRGLVEQEERLSDTVYCFHRASGKIEIAA